MKLIDQLNADLKIAMKGHNKVAISTIRMVNAAIIAEKHKSAVKEDFTDEDIIQIISKEVKMRKDSIEEYIRGGRQDLVAVTQLELNVLLNYLPKQLSKEEIVKIIDSELANHTEPLTKKDIGKIMKVIMPLVKGKADGKLVNQLVLEAISKG